MVAEYGSAIKKYDARIRVSTFRRMTNSRYRAIGAFCDGRDGNTARVAIHSTTLSEGIYYYRCLAIVAIVDGMILPSVLTIFPAYRGVLHDAS